MRRIFLALTVAAMMAVFAVPAKAQVVDVDVDEDLCSPFIDEVDILDCVFSNDNGFVGDLNDNDLDIDDLDDGDLDFDDGGLNFDNDDAGFIVGNGFVGSFDDDDNDVDFGRGAGKIGNGHNGGKIGNSHHGGGGKGKK
jgi:hypothetical protein